MFGNIESYISSSRIARCLRWSLVAFAAALVATTSLSQDALAVPINYGDLFGNTVDYLDIEEDANSAGDVPPLFGPPAVSGDSLDFDPVGFGASATGAAGNDVTDGNLKFVIMSHAGYGIKSVQLTEAGDISLGGFGTDATYASVTCFGVLNIDEVDGAGIATIAVPFSMTFSPSGGTFGLLTDGGGGPDYSDEWSGFWSEDIEQVLNDNGIFPARGATKLSINLDNRLRALSEAGTDSLIAKKDFGGLSVTAFTIPEPAACLLVGLAVIGLGLIRRR